MEFIPHRNDDQLTTRLRNSTAQRSAWFDLIGDQLALGLLWFEGPDAIVDAVSYAKFFSRSQSAVIRLFDESGAVVETHEQVGEFKDW